MIAKLNKENHFHIDSTCYEQVAETWGKKIAERCYGLPLAATILGGVLSTKNPRQWEDMHNKISYLLGETTETLIDSPSVGAMTKILGFSYDNLPATLKSCFMCTTLFTENTWINPSLLYHIWIAEGLVSTDHKKREQDTLMDVVEYHLEELVERYMMILTLVEDLNPNSSKYTYIQLHDITKQVFLHKAKEEKLLEIIDSEQNQEDILLSSSPLYTSRPRQMKLNIKGLDAAEKWPSKHIEERTRLLYLIVNDAADYHVLRLIGEKLKEFTQFRVLIITGFTLTTTTKTENTLKNKLFRGWETNKLQEALGNLYMLKFLHVEDSKFMELSSVIGKLEKLLVLNVRLLDTRMVTAELRKLMHLKCLYHPRDVEIKKKKSFCHRQRILSFHMFQKLEELENFDVSYYNVKDLSALPKIRRLTTTLNVKNSNLQDFISEVLGASNLWGWSKKFR